MAGRNGVMAWRQQTQWQCFTRRRFSHGGFTLIELIAVIVVMGILAAVAVPAMSSTTQTRVGLAAKQMLRDVDEQIVTNDMHERKILMFQRSDAFVALPGGIGTLEELVEQLTWSQLGQHTKPIVVANIKNFWSPFLELLEHMRDQQFIRASLEISFAVVDHTDDIVPTIKAQIEKAGRTGEETGILEKF